MKFIFKPYKCFKKEIVFNEPKLVNLIIGRNNIGKSSLLELLETVYLRKQSLGTPRRIVFGLGKKISAQDLSYINVHRTRYMFTETVSVDEYLDELIDKDIRILTSFDNKVANIEFDNKIDYTDHSFEFIGNLDVWLKCIPKYSCLTKIAADRNIVPEKKDDNATVNSDGSGFVSKLLFNAENEKGSRKLIDRILADLNEILTGECKFDKLSIFNNDDNQYEIFLINESGEIPLSQMGSGIKTLLFVLFVLNDRLIHKTNSILMFEELENNLHPEIQRRLFEKIYKYAIDNDCRVFITTHSNIAINTLYNKDDTAIYHIFKDSEGGSVVDCVENNNAKRNILDDIGVKASDIFQSNGIIWVEGPSDRIYINKWLALVSPELKENAHYSFLYYGGKNLFHHALESIEGDNMIDILLTNKNSALVMDSDKKFDEDGISETKERILKQFLESGMFCWVTKGKEIENYISAKSINAIYGKKKKQVGQYDSFKKYIKNIEPNFETKKVDFAKQILFEDKSLDILDLREKIIKLSDEIKRWNKLG